MRIPRPLFSVTRGRDATASTLQSPPLSQLAAQGAVPSPRSSCVVWTPESPFPTREQGAEEGQPRSTHPTGSPAVATAGMLPRPERFPYIGSVQLVGNSAPSNQASLRGRTQPPVPAGGSVFKPLQPAPPALRPMRLTLEQELAPFRGDALHPEHRHTSTPRRLGRVSRLVRRGAGCRCAVLGELGRVSSKRARRGGCLEAGA